VYPHFFAELFVVARAEPAYWLVVDVAKLALGVVVIKSIFCRKFFIYSVTFYSLNYMNSIMLTIE
jgi:hypothetical protein